MPKQSNVKRRHHIVTPGRAESRLNLSPHLVKSWQHQFVAHSKRLMMWQLITNSTFHTIRAAGPVAMGMHDWDFIPLIVWIVHFPWVHEGVFMCAVTQQLLPSRWGRAVVRLVCKTRNRFCPSSWATIQPLFLIRGSYCSPGGSPCGGSGWSNAQVLRNKIK